MSSSRFNRILAMPLALALAILACGGPATQEAPTKGAAQPTDAPAPAPTTESAGGIASYQDVKKATLQILAQGTFYEPQAAQPNAEWGGSGFLISSDGLAVTNNHVVTGAARIKAYLEGKEYTARVLGVSECSDLAVIQLEGNGFPYLEFHSGDVQPGLEVYAAGFPLLDPEFTLTKGIVSKARANGESNWASVASVIQHDATINPGNSGGPLVDADGRLVGINYAGDASSNQYFAIKAQDARDVIDQLSAGSDVDSIGINGEAIVWNDGANYGIWVASVKSGSPADKAGVKPGDILTAMEGLSLGSQGTMTEYCDVIRSHRPTDTLSIDVLRYNTQEVLTGQLNGRELAVSYSFAQNLGTDVQSTTGGTSGEYSGYVEVFDDSQAIKMQVPAEWSDVSGGAWTDNGDKIGVAITAAANVQGFHDTWTEPGVFFGVSNQLSKLGGYIQLLDINRDSFSQACTYKGRTDYADSAFEGKYDVFTNCKNSDNVFVVLSARPIADPTAYLILVQVQIMTDADLKALDQIFATFNVVGQLP